MRIIRINARITKYLQNNIFTDQNISTCDSRKVYVFRSTNVRTSANITPSLDIFRRDYTKLKILVSVHPGDCFTQEQMINDRDEHLQTHVQHGASQCVTENLSSTSYLVGTGGEAPRLFQPKFYYIFSLLGLSLPYRWFVYFKTGRVKFEVRKRVFQGESSSTEAPSVQNTGPEVLPEVRTPPLPTVPLVPEVGPPPSYASCARPETPPPDYEAACSQIPLKVQF